MILAYLEKGKKDIHKTGLLILVAQKMGICTRSILYANIQLEHS